MVQNVLQPRKVGIAFRRDSEPPPDIISEAIPAPIRDVEGRISENEVGFEVGQFVAMKAALVVPANVRVDPLDSEVHFGQSPGCVVDLLPINGDVLPPPAMLLNKLFGLDEHAARAAAGIIDAALVRLQHLEGVRTTERGVKNSPPRLPSDPANPERKYS